MLEQRCSYYGKLSKGFKITVHSAIEATKFLLEEGMEYVLTERFCHDPVEEYFGNQRKLGRRNDNPDVYSFGYHDNTIRIQRTISCQSGNTRGRKDRLGFRLPMTLYHLGKNLRILEKNNIQSFISSTNTNTG